MDTQTRSDPGLDNIYLRDILHEMWDRKILFFSFLVLCLLAVSVALIFVPRRYEAATVIDPMSDTTNSQAGVLGTLTSGLSALAGLSTSSDAKKVESVAILQSEALTSRYIEENNLLPILYAQLWDASRSQWKTTDPAKIPTVWKATQYFKKYLRTITTEGKTGLVTLTVTWGNAQQAAAWANGLVKLANDYERDTAISTSEQNIAYLTAQAAGTDVVGIRQAIYTLLEREYSRAMLAKGNREFAFKIIDPAIVAEKAAYPQKTVWILVTFFASLSIVIFVAFVRVSWRQG